MTILIRKDIPFKVVFKNDAFILIKVEPDYQYEDNKRTDKIIGWKYEVVDTVNFDKIKVKIKGQKNPLITDEQLQSLKDEGVKTVVEFINGIITPYIRTEKKGTGHEYMTVEDSFSASDIRLVQND